MKKSFSLFKGAAFNKLGLLPFLVTFLFIASLQMDVKAQSSSSTLGNPAQMQLYVLPAGPFVSSNVAKERLFDAIKTLKTTLGEYPENSGPYQAAFRRYMYFQHIIDHLEAGKTVAQSIVDGLAAINNSNSLVGGVTPEEMLVEKNAAIDLLRP